MSRGLYFLARFVLISGLVYGFWQVLAPFYLALVAPATNALFALSGLPMELELRGRTVLLAYQHSDGWLRLQARDYDAVYLNIIAATALLAAWPGRTLGWKLRWSGTALGLLWFTHVASFWAGGQIAVWEYLEAPSGAAAPAGLAAEWARHVPLARRDLLTQILAQWNVWGRYGLAAGLWFFALRHEVVGWSLGGVRREVRRPLWDEKVDPGLKEYGKSPKNIRLKYPG